MKFTAEMAEAYKSSDPIVKFSLKRVKKGQSIGRDAAIKVAIEIFKASPELELDSICAAIGHADILPDITDQCAEIYAQSVGAPAAEGSSADDEDPADLPTGNSYPTLAESDADKTINDLYSTRYSFAARERETQFSSSDESIARMAAYCLGHNNCRRQRRLESWLTWTGSYWHKCDEGDIRTLLSKLGECVEMDLKAVRRIDRRDAINRVSKRYHVQSLDTAEELFELELKTMGKIVARLQSLQGLQIVSKRMGDFVMVDPEHLDANECELVFKNTCWNAKEKRFYKPRRESLSTRSTDLVWTDPSKEACEKWQNYLTGLGFDEVTLRFLKRSFGYACLGRGSEKRFWWFRGQSNTSKTTLIQLVARCLGTYAEITPTKLWLVKGGGQPGHTDDLAALKGARLVYADEFPQISRFDDSLLKQVTSGSAPIRASEKGEKGIKFKVQFALFCASNFDPHLSEEDDAAMHRLTSLTFRKPVEKKDSGFIEKFLDDDTKMAILAWLMDGALEYLKEGFGEEPNAVKQSREEFTSGQISVADQLAELVIKGPTDVKSGLRMSDILKALTDYQAHTRQKAFFTARSVTRVISEKFSVDPEKSGGHTVFPGLRLSSRPSRENEPKIGGDPRLDWGYNGDYQ